MYEMSRPSFHPVSVQDGTMFHFDSKGLQTKPMPKTPKLICSDDKCSAALLGEKQKLESHPRQHQS